jgi:hypothetical protein
VPVIGLLLPSVILLIYVLNACSTSQGLIILAFGLLLGLLLASVILVSICGFVLFISYISDFIDASGKEGLGEITNNAWEAFLVKILQSEFFRTLVYGSLKLLVF